MIRMAAKLEVAVEEINLMYSNSKVDMLMLNLLLAQIVEISIGLRKSVLKIILNMKRAVLLISLDLLG